MTRVSPLTGGDGRCWQPACQPPPGAWQADSESGAVPLRRNKLRPLEGGNARHTHAHVQMETFVPVAVSLMRRQIVNHAGCSLP